MEYLCSTSAQMHQVWTRQSHICNIVPGTQQGLLQGTVTVSTELPRHKTNCGSLVNLVMWDI